MVSQPRKKFHFKNFRDLYCQPPDLVDLEDPRHPSPRLPAKREQPGVRASGAGQPTRTGKGQGQRGPVCRMERGRNRIPSFNSEVQDFSSFAITEYI